MTESTITLENNTQSLNQQEKTKENLNKIATSNSASLNVAQKQYNRWCRVCDVYGISTTYLKINT